MRTHHTIVKRSPRTGRINQMDMQIDPADYEKWMAGAMIQNAMPYLTPTEREFLKTGYTQEDWDAMFPPEQD
jgi:hypothetical protein